MLHTNTYAVYVVFHHTSNFPYVQEGDRPLFYLKGLEGLKLRMLSSIVKRETSSEYDEDHYRYDYFLSKKGWEANSRAVEILKAVIQRIPQKRRPEFPSVDDRGEVLLVTEQCTPRPHPSLRGI